MGGFILELNLKIRIDSQNEHLCFELLFVALVL